MFPLSNMLKSFVRLGTLRVIDAEGKTHIFGGQKPGPDVTMRLTDPTLYRTLFFNPELAAGEAYMDGRMSFENSTLRDFLTLFSINRLYGEALLPDGATYTFWGKGLSQGHSDAVRRVPGVKAGVQYTLPSEAAIQQVRGGTRPELSTRQKHTRECHVVLEEGADAAAVEQAIVSMPNYFADYDTSVHFISEETLRREHNRMPHGGFVIRSGSTSEALMSGAPSTSR